MQRFLPAASLLLALALVSPLRAADEPKKDAGLKSAGEMTGKLTHVEGAGKGFRFEIEVPVPNPQAMQQIAQLRMQMARAQNPQQALQYQQQLAQQQRNMYRMQKQEIEVMPAEDIKVRMKNPPVAFDEKGNVKKYTAKELKELKGDDKGPGYPAEFDSLRPGQYVTVTLKVKKDVPKPKPGAKGADADFLNENKPIATQVTIVMEAPPQP